MRRRLSSVSIVTFLAFVACSDKPSQSPSSPPAATSEAPVSFSLPSSDGTLVRVPLPSARATVLDFFGPTCEPCAKKVPALVRRRAEIEARGGRLVLVAVLADGETTADAERALAKWGATAAFLVDKGDVSRREGRVVALPSTLIVDTKGNVQWRAPATANADDVIAALR